MTPERATVYVVDDDDAIRRSVRALLSTMEIDALDYPSAEAFLEEYDGRRPACLITDVRMLGMSGLELQQRLNELDISIPVIVITAYAATPMTVRAMQQGAFTFLEKPCDEDALYNAVNKAISNDRQRYSEELQEAGVRERLESLTPQERAVFDHIVHGDANKIVARRLNLSVRTVETYRRRVFEKMQADSLAELVRMSVQAGE